MYGHTLHNTWILAFHIMTPSLTTSCFQLKFSQLSRQQNTFKTSHMVNRILYSWSFDMKFMKLAKGDLQYSIKPIYSRSAFLLNVPVNRVLYI